MTEQPGYPSKPQPRPQQPGYPSKPQPRPQQPGYPSQPQPKPQQPGYPPKPQQPGYPPKPQQPGYPPSGNFGWRLPAKTEAAPSTGGSTGMTGAHQNYWSKRFGYN
ncbi:annexin A7-like [Epinephelus moara]|uniref:annexin A7-like n=1 Tax=Epinephelus moara TaxID=300413 RepID=UPI00214E8F5A|nr:annexin A7-like [Epinephelus moara]